jgi:hypothetical protein
MNHRVGRTGGHEWVSLVNHSGEMDKVLLDPIPVRDVRIRLQTHAPVKSVRLLNAKREVKFATVENGRVECMVPEITNYEIVLFQ